jgi:hypothetical protein
MAFLIREHFKKELNELFGLNEDELDDIVGEVGGEAPAEDPATDPAAEPAADPAAETGEEPAADPATEDPAATDPATEDPEADPAAEEDDLAGAAPEPPESEIVPGTGDEVKAEGTEGTDDNSKVDSMFKDIGKPETDYGLTNPNNIRLAKFRFKKAGITVEQMMDETEKKIGMTAEKLIYRLTPEQYESYKDKGKELRKKYDLIEKREKNIIMFNSRIPIYYRDENTKEVQKIDEHNPNLLKNAFSKIDEFMIKRFGEHWVDDLNAVDFLQGIKVNFAEKETITPNMITAKFFATEEDKIMPFNKLYVKTPKSVDDFVKENKENQSYLRSAVYRALAAGYLDDSTDRTGVFAMITGEEGADGGDEAASEGADVGAEGDMGADAAAASGDEAAPDGDADVDDIDAMLGDTGGDAGGDSGGGEEPPPEPV